MINILHIRDICTLIKKHKNRCAFLLAESGGFEPPKAFTLPLFESGTIDLSDNSPCCIFTNLKNF